MKRSVAVVAVVWTVLAQSAWAKHYSFVGGYPANGVSAERAKSLENGGASVSTSVTYRDAQGRTVMTQRKSANGSTYWDGQGRVQGRSTPGAGGQTTYWNAQGQIQGRKSESATGTTYWDGQGHMTGRSTTSPGGRTTYYDAQGRITGSSTTSPSGQTTYYDAQGRVRGTKNSP